MLRRSCTRAFVALTASLLFAGCGTHVRSAAPPASQVTAAFRGAPAALIALHVQANRLLAGGTSAFESRLASLRGYPVVVNKWASWCEPCQSEFPVFQRVGVALARRVAFVGLDGKDADAAAIAFLKRFPVSYPSYVDPSEDIARKLEAAVYYPQTIYFDRRGTRVFTHVGPYESVSALERDIRYYLLRGA